MNSSGCFDALDRWYFQPVLPQVDDSNARWPIVIAAIQVARIARMEAKTMFVPSVVIHGIGLSGDGVLTPSAQYSGRTRELSMELTWNPISTTSRSIPVPTSSAYTIRVLRSRVVVLGIAGAFIGSTDTDAAGWRFAMLRLFNSKVLRP